MKRILAMALAILMIGAAAWAMPIQLSEGSVATTARTLEGEDYTLNTDAFQLMGTDEAGDYLIYADNQVLKVSGSAIRTVLNALEVVLPSEDSLQTLSRGSRGEDVIALQEALKALGYLSGSADGDFGGMTERAISEVQASLEMEETGTADPIFQMLVRSMADTPFELTRPADPEAEYEAIAGKTGANLGNILELGLALDYDDISGTGRLENGAIVTYEVPTEMEVDKRTFTLEFALAVNQSGSGMMSITPVLDVRCVGSQRPTVQKVILKSGDERHTVAIDELKTSLSGLDAVEEGSALLDNETAMMLSKVQENGELKMRIICKYDEYDVIVEEDKLPRIAAVGEAALGL